MLVVDLPTGVALPRGLVADEQGTIAFDPARISGVIEHPSWLLSRIDASDCAVDVVVLSVDAAPSSGPQLRRWGYGWRCGRDLEADWLPIAALEGRVRSTQWIHVDGDIRAVTSWPVEGVACDLRGLLIADSTEIWICRRRSAACRRFRDVSTPVFDSRIRVCHGSPVLGLDRLVPDAGRLWVSHSDAFAACFGATPYSNRGWYQGVDRVSASVPVIYMVVPAGEERVLDRPCSLYESDASTREICFAGVSGYELVIHRDATVFSEHRFDSCHDALGHHGVELILLSQAPVIDDELAGRCRPFRQALEAFLAMPLDVALRIPCKQWALHFWLAARGVRSLEVSELPWLRDVMERLWLPPIAAATTLAERGYHSIEHLLQVSSTAAYIAQQEGENLVVSALAGLLHDSGRQGNEDGSSHAERGVALMERVLGRPLRYLLAPADYQRVREAIALHATDRTSQDRAIGACWDADRLRLAWERGVDRAFFSTPTGLDLALAGGLDGKISGYGSGNVASQARIDAD